MRVALFGAAGQLGTDLQRQSAAEIVPFRHGDADITDRRSVEAALERARADRCINAAAYNRVDAAEDEPERAYAVNALGPRNLALCCEARGIALAQVSTDYIFSGRLEFGGRTAVRTMPYRECDRPGPLSAYGVSKLAGEYFVRALCPRHFVVRTCGLYGPPGEGRGNFVLTMLRLGQERGEVRVVDDQRCTPTSTADLAHALLALLETEEYGLYHATAAGSTSWSEFAQAIFRLAGLDVGVHPITSAEFGARAARPAFSVLDGRKLAGTLGFALPEWRESLARYLETCAEG